MNVLTPWLTLATGLPEPAALPELGIVAIWRELRKNSSI